MAREFESKRSDAVSQTQPNKVEGRFGRREFTPELKKRMERILEKNKDKYLEPGLYSLAHNPDVPVPSSTDLPLWKVAAPFNKVVDGIVISEL